MVQLRHLDASVALGKVVWHEIEDLAAGHQQRTLLRLTLAVDLEHLDREKDALI